MGYCLCYMHVRFISIVVLYHYDIATFVYEEIWALRSLSNRAAQGFSVQSGWVAT